MNCNSWGTYEAPGTSETAALCNGGTVDEELWAPCPSREACRAARSRRVIQEAQERAAGKVHLPQAGQQQQNSVVRVMGGQGMPRPMSGIGAPGTTLPQRPVGGPAQVVKPENGNPYLDTPRVLTPTRAGMHSPTFLPHKKEPWLTRLVKNMFQGVLNSLGWHLHDYTQHTDLFPHDEE